ncbi:MAG TPA: formimidoylglutamate deiminase [Rhizomicrobium sp.]|jgi:formiminoglutamate deiminase|nr:formimidoylglutamate deiminase [Rhizomicrobium sp.]
MAANSRLQHVPMLWFDTVLLPQGWARDVRIETADGKIARLETGTRPSAGDERHTIAVPGLANVHSHAFQRGMAGLAERRGPAGDNFWTWREVMYRFLDRMTPDDVHAIAKLAYVEMLERGFTRVGEFHYLHHDRSGGPYASIAAMADAIASAAGETDIGLTLLPVFYAHGNFGAAPPVAGQRRFLSDRDSFATLFEHCKHAISGLPDANIGVAPHSLRAVTPSELVQIVALADGGPVHIHAAEQTKEVEDCLAWSGARPVEWLLDHAGVNASWTLVHATHVTAREIGRLAESGAVAGLCPITEANLGDGIFPASEFLARRGRFGIGTDSNVEIGAAAELRGLEYSQRLTRRARNLWPSVPETSTGRALFEGALAGGAQSLDRLPCGIRAGASADIVSFDADDPTFAGRMGDAVLDSWIFAGGKIDCVWRRGKKVVSGGRHSARPAAEDRYRGVVLRLLCDA